MNYSNIIQLKYPQYVLTHVGTGDDYYALTWSDFNPSPNPIPKATLDQDIADAIASGITGPLEDLTQSGQEELSAIANIGESSGFVKKVGHAMYTLDASTYLTEITSSQINTALGYVPYDSANPATYTTKNYVDNLMGNGITWLRPVHGFNFVGTASSPPSVAHPNENYIISTGGNTGAWSSFSVGDRVSWVGGTWVLREVTNIGCRLGVCFDKTTTGVGDALGKDNQIGEIIGGDPSGWIWSWDAPEDNNAVFNNYTSSTKFGESYTYNLATDTWTAFSSNIVGDGAGLSYDANLLNVNVGKGLEIISDKVSAKIYSNGGIMTTLDGSTSSSSDSASLCLSTVGTPGIYTKMEVDQYGRITSGSIPTTLSGYGITDAVHSNTLGVPSGVATLDTSGKLTYSQLPNITLDWYSVSNTPTTLSGYGITDGVNTSLVGTNNGIATLDSSGKLTTSQIPDSLIGAVVYQGVWNASTNTPTLVSGTGTKGHYYKVSVAGSTNIDGLSQWNLGDVIIYNGTTWDKIDGISNEVILVAGKTGVVTLTSSDVGLGNVDNLKQLPYTQLVTFSGDVIASSTLLNTGTIPTSLATVNANTGSFGTASQVGNFTVNGKGLITAASNINIQITESQVTNLTTSLSSKIPLSTVTTTGDLIVGTGSATVSRLGIGTNGQVLTSNGTTATWANAPSASGMPWSMPIPITGASGQPFSQVNSRTLTAVVRFIFRGSSVLGVPTSIRGASSVASVNSGGQILIQDITNNLTIATTGATINHTTYGIDALTNIANVSTGEAIWEVQINTLSGNMAITAVTINFN